MNTDSPSPRLEWMRRHGVSVMEYRLKTDGEPDYLAFIGGSVAEALRNQKYAANGAFHAEGNTPDDAITKLAIANNLKLWNEE